MSTGWRLRPGTVVVEVAPSRSAGNPKRKAPSTCRRSVRRRPSGKDAVPQVVKLLSPKQDDEAKRKRCVRRQDAVIGTVHESREAHLARHGGGQNMSSLQVVQARQRMALFVRQVQPDDMSPQRDRGLVGRTSAAIWVRLGPGLQDLRVVREALCW